MVVLGDRPSVRHTPAVVGDTVVGQRGGHGCDPAVRATSPNDSATLPFRRALAHPECGGDAGHAPVPFCDVDGAARFVHRLEHGSVAVSAELSRRKIAERPGILVGMHVPGVVQINAVLAKQRLQRLTDLRLEFAHCLAAYVDMMSHRNARTSA